MNKRTDRNKSLYTKVNKKIEEIVKNRSNKEFEDTTQTLKKVDSAFFSDEEETSQVEIKTQNQKNNKKIWTIVIVVALIIVVGIIVAVVSLK